MSKFSRMFAIVLLAAFSARAQASAAGSLDGAAAINSVGIDLLHQTARPDANILLSPYSIETALAMTYAGADGVTQDQMARVLHLQGNGEAVAGEFSDLQQSLLEMVQRTVRAADSMKENGVTNSPIELDIANRLFGQQGYDFKPAFLELLKDKYAAPFDALDFQKDSTGAAKTINDWVGKQTKDRIQNLVPGGALNRRTRLVLVNAIYLKAPWAEPFAPSATTPRPFHPSNGAVENVPTMSIQKSFGYVKTNGLTIVSLPYSGEEMQLLIILPDDANGLAKAEEGMSAGQLDEWAELPQRQVKLFLPKFKIQPPTLPLGDALKKLGMTSAFDIPRGSANFDRIAPRRPDDYLYISDVFHKTFISVDEKGTEAAAATAVVMMKALAIMRPIAGPVEVHVDHPFIFAIQHRASGACLFLGHIINPARP